MNKSETKTSGFERFIMSVSKVLDKIKALGFKYSTIGAITTSVFDMQISGNKKILLQK